MSKVIGVITADIVASRDLSPKRREALYADVKAGLQALKKEGWLASYELYRGDSFQCVAARPELALRVALLIRSFFKAYSGPGDSGSDSKYDVRIAAAVGGVDFFSKTDLAHSDGEAFRLSGEGLDSLRDVPWRLALRTGDAALTESLAPAVLLLDAVLQKWTAPGAEAVFYRLKELKEEAISRQVGVSQPAINQRLKAAQWYAVDALLQYFEKTINPQHLG
ncbi:MAG TPA: hypothetical protein VGE66_06775 [Chitinophagaceae bacterium]